MTGKGIAKAHWERGGPIRNPWLQATPERARRARSQ